jgi:hypothetical protein
MKNIDFIYSKHIKPLSNKERLIILQKIMKDFIYEQKEKKNSAEEKLKILRKFKGIAKPGSPVINEEDWYKQ